MSARTIVSIAVLLGAVGLGAAISVVSGKLILWDLRNYHLYNAFVFATDRMGQDLNPAYFQSYINPLPYLPFYALVRSGLPDHVVGALLGGLHAVCLWLLFGISRHLMSEAVPRASAGARDALALLASLVGVAGAMFLPLLGSSSADPLSSVAVLSGVWLLVLARAGRADTLRCALASLVFGLALGAKLTNAVFAAAFAIVFVAWRWRQPGFARSLGAVAIAGAVGILIGGGFWSAILLEHFDSPLFPFYNALLGSPYTGLENFRDMRFIPESWLTALFSYPAAFAMGTSRTLETPFFEPRWLVLLTLVVAWAARRIANRRRPIEAVSQEPPSYAALWMILAFVGSSYAIWLAMFAIQRYLLPAELLAGPCIVGLLLLLVRRPGAAAVAIGVLLVVVVAFTKPPRNIWQRVAWKGPWLSVEVPGIEDPARTTVLILASNPAGYIVPFLPNEVRVARVLARKFEGHLLWQELERTVSDRSRTLLVLIDPDREPLARSQRYLDERGIEVDREGCRALAFETHRDRLSLCPTRRALPVDQSTM